MKHLTMLATLALALSLAACNKNKGANGPMEEAGEDMDEAAEDTEEAADEAGEEMEDAADEASDEVDGDPSTD